MKNTTLLIASLCSFGLTACQQIPISSTDANAQVIEQVDYLQAFPSTEGNTAKLVKQKEGCIIEFYGLYETGRATEQWTFKGNQLLSAHTTISHYADGGLANAENKGKDIQIASQQKNTFDIQDSKTQDNFKALIGNFKAASLAQC